jgi:hypothetical protein
MGRKELIPGPNRAAFDAFERGMGEVVKDAIEKGVSLAAGAEPKAWKQFLDNIVFRDELVNYVTSVVNNTEPDGFVWDEISVAPGSVLLHGERGQRSRRWDLC